MLYVTLYIFQVVPMHITSLRSFFRLTPFCMLPANDSATTAEGQSVHGYCYFSRGAPINANLKVSQHSTSSLILTESLGVVRSVLLLRY